MQGLLLDGHIKPQDFPAETANCSVNEETEKLQFIRIVYMSHEVWSQRYIHLSFKFVWVHTLVYLFVGEPS